jgi:hypothetical protein
MALRVDRHSVRSGVRQTYPVYTPASSRSLPRIAALRQPYMIIIPAGKRSMRNPDRAKLRLGRAEPDKDEDLVRTVPSSAAERFD